MCYDKINIYEGKLGKETLLYKLDIDESVIVPSVNDFIAIDTENDGMGNVYVVKQFLIDYIWHEYNIFVELYNWED